MSLNDKVEAAIWLGIVSENQAVDIPGFIWLTGRDGNKWCVESNEIAILAGCLDDDVFNSAIEVKSGERSYAKENQYEVAAKIKAAKDAENPDAKAAELRDKLEAAEAINAANERAEKAEARVKELEAELAAAKADVVKLDPARVIATASHIAFRKSVQFAGAEYCRWIGLHFAIRYTEHTEGWDEAKPYDLAE